MDFSSVAKICHEANKAYCETIGDNSQVPWDEAPDWQKESAIIGVKMHAENPDAGPEASHKCWMEQKLAEGWKYGPVKNPETKEHPCIVHFADLPKEQQVKDVLFRAIVHALIHDVK